MKINIKATNIELTPEISDYLDKKLSAFEKFKGEDIDQAICRVEIGKISDHHKTGDVFKAEINMTISGKNFYAVSEESDLFAAIDKVKDETLSEVRSFVDKKKTLTKKGGAEMKKIIKGEEEGD